MRGQSEQIIDAEKLQGVLGGPLGEGEVGAEVCSPTFGVVEGRGRVGELPHISSFPTWCCFRAGTLCYLFPAIQCLAHGSRHLLSNG